jgi:DNA-binding SARP family transcriptional activator
MADMTRSEHANRRREGAARLETPIVAPSLARDRLTQRLEAIDGKRLAIVLAGAGAGKTTLLANFTMASRNTVAWYNAVAMDGDGARLLRSLQTVFAPYLSDDAEWHDGDDMIDAMTHLHAGPTVLVVDDFHAIVNTPGEHLVERLVLDSAASLIVVLGTRRAPSFDLSRLRMSEALVEIGPDDLRFRSWEVERLYREVYSEPLPPDELAELTRRTEGWAAGLQLYHLITQRQAAPQRQRFLAGLGGRSRLVHEYLARNVFEGLAPDLRQFLLGTCVFERLTGPLCDRLLSRTGSTDVLRTLEREQLFTYLLDDSGVYRYHEIFRSHLEAMMVETIGESRARDRYRAAGVLLEEAGALPDALRAFCRAEEWEAAVRLLGRSRELAESASASWLDVIPRFIVNGDPWLLVASARRHRAAGRISAAVDAFTEAESTFETAKDRELCRREKLALLAWTDRRGAVPEGWLGHLRDATSRDPLRVRRHLGGAADPHSRFVAGAAALLAGDVRDATSLLQSVRYADDTTPELGAITRLALGAALLFQNDPGGRIEVERAAEDAERLGLIWLTRLARAALALDGRPDEVSEALAARLAFEREGDLWGSMLAALMHGWGLLRNAQSPAATFEAVIDTARRLGAGAIEAWARGGLALAMATVVDDQARLTAVQAEAFSRSAGVTSAQALAFRALAQIDPSSSDFSALAEQLERESGLVPPLPSTQAAEQAHLFPSVEIRCFGGFRIAFFGTDADLSGIKPRARAVLRLLATHGGRPLHREVLQAALWPDARPEAAARILHVAISSLRHALDPHLPAGAGSLIRRHGETYELTPPEDALFDVRDFDRLSRDAALAEMLEDHEHAANLYRRALDLCQGELLPEDGPADWVEGERERRRSDICKIAASLARIHRSRGEHRAAADACEIGLRHDRFRDDLWRMRIEAYESTGDIAAAARAREAYDGLLLDLGVVSRTDEPAHHGTHG